MVELFLIFAAIVIAYFLVVYVIAPISGILLTVTVVLGIGYSLFTSIRSFVTSLFRNINPYTTFIDNCPTAQNGIYRNYFFGPGYHQLSSTVREAFSLQGDYLKQLETWKDALMDGSWFIKIWIWIFYVVAVFCTSVLGFIWVAFFSILLSAILVAGMSCFYLFFTALWCTDRLILTVNAIQSRCPRCKRISVVPNFICPDCGLEHAKLTPGPYGVFTRKCLCGKRLATTYFTGRSKYKAVCPICGCDLAASDARQFGIQLVGGVSTGKTTFLAAFWHEYLERVSQIEGISVSTSPTEAFDELEYWFQHGDSASTTETNANMYSLIHNFTDKTPLQMSIYDIAGEAFASLANDVQQQQFEYCEGIVFIIDPTADPLLVSETISCFINEFGGLKGKHAMAVSNVPVSVIITKADLHKRLLGLPIIRSTFVNRAQNYADSEGNTSLELVRNGMCRCFLENNGFANAMNLIDAQFPRAQYYSVSAIGHAIGDGLQYEPWGVLEPITWILSQQGDIFQDIVLKLN